MVFSHVENVGDTDVIACKQDLCSPGQTSGLKGRKHEMHEFTRCGLVVTWHRTSNIGSGNIWYGYLVSADLFTKFYLHLNLNQNAFNYFLHMNM